MLEHIRTYGLPRVMAVRILRDAEPLGDARILLTIAACIA